MHSYNCIVISIVLGKNERKYMLHFKSILKKEKDLKSFSFFFLWLILEIKKVILFLVLIFLYATCKYLQGYRYR